MIQVSTGSFSHSCGTGPCTASCNSQRVVRRLGLKFCRNFEKNCFFNRKIAEKFWSIVIPFCARISNPAPSTDLVTQWWRMTVCSRYVRTHSLKVSLQGNLSFRVEMHPSWEITRHATHFTLTLSNKTFAKYYFCTTVQDNVIPLRSQVQVLVLLLLLSANEKRVMSAD